ncbi:MAG TPA: ATP-binding protein, partial [Actinomycetota bacterium]|nr:ATP-binding protein [Actinomycetota bacterium]
MSDLLPAARSDEFVLMVSEIVGNAVRHGKPEADGRIGLRLRDDDSVIRVAVVDGAPRFTFDR